nr:flagellar hook-basal body complex protein FliE [Alteribacter natronophilus]
MAPLTSQIRQPVSAGDKGESFSSWLNGAIGDVNQKQIDSQDMTAKLVRGENVDLHNVMITSQKAGIALQTTVEVRDKAIEAYQEMMRMQV